MTLGTLGTRQCTGQLTLRSEGKQYCIVFDAGAVVGASSPLAIDSAARVALVNHLVAASQVSEINRRVAAAPEREEIDVLADVVRLSLDQKLRLRRKVIEQRAARTFAIDHGDFVIDSDVTVSVIPGLAIDIRSVIYVGARTILSEERLASELRPLGSRFTLVEDAGGELPHFGFTDTVRPILDALRHGTTFAEIEAKHRELDPRQARAVVYALVSCSVCRAVATAPPLHLELEPSPSDVYMPSRTSAAATPSEVYSRTHTGTREVYVPRASSRPSAAPPSSESRTMTPDPRTPRSTPTMSPDPRTPRSTPTTMTPEPGAPRTTTPEAPARTPTAPPYIPGPRASASTAPPSSDGGNTPRALPSRGSSPTIARSPTPVSTPRANTPSPQPRTKTPSAPSRSRTRTPATPFPSRTRSPGVPAAPGTPASAPPATTADPTSSGSGSHPRMSSGSTPPQNVTHGFKAPAPGDERPPVDVVAAAREAFRRGQSALRDEALAEAIAEFTKAVEFTPNEVDYSATLAWARFCAASDKQKVADVTRNTLGLAIRRSQTPEVARFYLGRMERMLGRDKEALRHFHQVLEAQPRHADAAAEIRVIEARLHGPSGGGGLFGRKR